MNLPRNKVGVLMESDFYEKEIFYYEHRFYVDEDVVVDGDLVTARTGAHCHLFARKIIDILSHRAS